MADLTAKQKRFIEEYLLDLNATQAAIRAGYSEKTAHVQGPRMLENVRVKQAITDAQKERTERVQIDQDWVLARLKLISDRCVQEEAVCDRDGNQTGEFKFDSSGANRATELIAKHLGMFVDRVEHSGEIGIKKLEDFF